MKNTMMNFASTFYSIIHWTGFPKTQLIRTARNLVSGPLTICMLCSLCSCRKELSRPAVAQDARLNFFNASTTLLAEQNAQWIYLDKADTNNVNQPAFTNNYGVYTEFPFPPGNIAVIPQPPVTYMRISEGSHDIRFTNGLKQTVDDHTYLLKHDEPLCLYIADSAESYTVLPLYEPQIINSTRVRVRFVQLSPDADSLNCSLQVKNGQQVVLDGFPKNFRYRSFTPYLEIDTAGKTLRGNLLFNFAAKKDTVMGGITPAINAIVPAQPGRSYTVLIQGYRFGASYISKVDSSYKSIPANVKTVVRTNN